MWLTPYLGKGAVGMGKRCEHVEVIFSSALSPAIEFRTMSLSPAGNP
jgi:hypothetical protein